MFRMSLLILLFISQIEKVILSHGLYNVIQLYVLYACVYLIDLVRLHNVAKHLFQVCGFM